ncbi:receptor-like serine/threonine-protein kinase SD1-7 [Magnolia sinica]|uniref:receptor-like serine/threonine-protein kinase SD1-7 n=1 Tax=Magnolia sinica TaxID=86752 RepID=UPI0026599731|nr:receptor-like serine/threonine-protein kinase SD1-7 [Magnolia sinica]
MDVSGQIQLFTWSEVTHAWSKLWSQPRGVCDFYAYCGPNGACDDHSSSSCNCLNGFEPRSPREWESKVWSAGCMRRTPLRCGDGDGFMLMKKMRLPAPSHSLPDSSLQLKDCKATCRSDCSCTAYASVNENGTGCHLWHKELTGLQENNSSGQDIYVRLADFELDDGSKRRLWIIAPVIIPSMLLVFGSIICYFWRRVLVRRRTELRHKAKRETRVAESLLDLGINMSTINKSLQGGKDSYDFQVFNFATISAATGYFSVTNKLGEGGFGPVYKAWELWTNGRGSELIDPTLNDLSPIGEITRCIHMGLLCVQESAKDRPTMSNVAALLSNETATLPTPKRPAFSLGKNSSITIPGSCSVNLMTISVMEAR